MIQVEILDSNCENDLKKQVNSWIKNNNYEIQDIKFATSCYVIDDNQNYYFCAMIIYKLKLKELDLDGILKKW